MDTFESDGPGFAAALCPKCKRILPTAQFKRKLPKSETLSYGYTGDYNVVVDSANCRDCQPNKSRPPAERSKAAVLKLARSGDMRMHEAQTLLAQREARAKAQQSSAVNRRWASRWTVPWVQLISDIRKDKHTLTQQRRYVRRKGLDDSYYTAMLDTMRRVEAMCAVASRSGEPPQWTAWFHYLTMAEARHLTDLRVIAQEQQWSKANALHSWDGIPVPVERVPYIDHINERKRRIAAIESAAHKEYDNGL